MEITKENVDRLVNTSVENERLRNDLTSAKADKLVAQKEIDNLKSKISELEKATKEEKVSKVEIGAVQTAYNSWGDKFTKYTPITVTSDLLVVKDEIEKVVKSNYESKVDSLQKELKDVTKQLEAVKEDKEDYYRKTSKNFDKTLDKYHEEYKDKEEKLRSKISELKEELEKERNNKTDAELEAKRKEEMTILKKRIVDLEREVNELVGLGFFQRIWYKLTNIPAKAKAKEAYVETEEAVKEKLSRNYFWIW